MAHGSVTDRFDRSDVIAMTVGGFVDKNHQPAMKEIRTSLGPKKDLWDELIRFVEENHRVKSDFAFYGVNYGWAMRFRKGGKALLSLYPGKDSFVAQIVLGETSARKASGLKLGRNVRRVLENTRQLADGRWLFIRVNSKKDANDCRNLLTLKSESIKKKQ